MSNGAARWGTAWYRHIFDPRVVLSAYLLAAAIVTLVKLAPGDFVENGHLYQPLQNFAIFRNSFLHLIHGQDLYAAYPDEQWDLYRYSPTFGILFAPFALLPYAAGVVLWNIVNAGALFWAVWSIPHLDKQKRALALWFTFLALLTALGNAQSNALVAALMIGAYASQERKRPGLASMFIGLSVCVKPFGILALVPCLLCEGRRRLARLTAAFGLALAALPILVVSPGSLATLYRNWFATMIAFNQSRRGISVMGMLSTWFGWNPPSNTVVAAGVFVIAAVTFVGVARGHHSNTAFRLLTTASALIFVTIFNYAAESPTYVIAVAGVGLWFFTQPMNSVNAVLLALVFLFAELSSSSIFPRELRRDVFETYAIKAVPCVIVWAKLQWDLLRFGEATQAE